MRYAFRGVVLIIALMALAGCSAFNPGTAKAEKTAEVFHAHLADSEYGAACRMLTATTLETLEDDDVGTCAAKLRELAIGPAGSVESSGAYGRNAQVVLSQDTVFLTLSGQEWKVIAAGCTSRGERPYDCAVEGG
ncbi:outer membrane protein assembly factor BamD [Arthrobacter monumenti]